MTSIRFGGEQLKVDVQNPIPIFAKISQETPWSCFGIQSARFKSISSVKGETGCNCDEIVFCPHSNGTHLETRAHVYKNGPKVLDELLKIPPLMLAQIVNKESIGKGMLLGSSDIESIIIRTGLLVDRLESEDYDFTGSNPSFITEEEIFAILEAYPNVKFLLVDLPSVDPEADGGRLLAHKRFFSCHSSIGIVELCVIPKDLQEGMYALSLNVAPFDSDASPLKRMSEGCIFCKIIKGAIPCHKLAETPLSLAFLDINPLSAGHVLIIPKIHAAKMNELSDEHLADILPLAKRIANAIGCVDFNVLQNNGRLAHQEVDHVHFHLIPKPNESEGLGIRWPSQPTDHGKLGELAASLSSKLN